MDNFNRTNLKPSSNFSEVNLKALIDKIFQKKLLFAISVFLCLAVAYVYIKLSTPLYEVKTTILIDPSGKSRHIGESKYIDGEVGLIGTEKNLFNEMAILKSYSMVNKAIKELDFGVSYFHGGWYKQTEYYNSFPFKVEVEQSGNQLYGEKFYIRLLPDDKYELQIKVKEFTVSNPTKDYKKEYKKPFEFSQVYAFGDDVQHDYFNFKIIKPEDASNEADFADGELSFQLNSEASLTKSYLSKLEITQPEIQASIIRLQSIGPVLKKEKEFLQKLTEKFIESKLIEREEIASRKENFIQTRLLLVADSLAIAERNEEAFKRGAKAVDLGRSASNALDKLQQLETDQGQISLNVKYYYSMLDYIDDNKQIDKIIAPSVVGIDDPILNENLISLKTLITQYEEDKNYFGEKSIDLKNLKERIKVKTNSLKANLNSLIQSSELAMREINTQIKSIEKTINQLPRSEKRLVTLQRSTKLLGNLFDYLSQELAKAGIARAEDIPDTKVLDAPRMVGNGPVSPQKMMIMALGGVVGLLIPFVWIVFTGFDDENGNPDLLDSVSNIPILASISQGTKDQLLTSNGSASWQLKEAFRDLSASLQFLLPDSKKNVIGISSKMAGEGKTFSAVNLSMEFAEEGKRVLLIELNFRNPSIAKMLGESIKHDLSAYLNKEGDSIENIIHIYPAQPNLNFIPTYKSDQNPNQLILNARLKTMIDALKHDYDYIILDSPAFGLVSDYLLISKYVDIHLFILRKHYSDLTAISTIENLIEKGNMKTSYLLFNGYQNRTKVKEYSNSK